MPQIPLSLLKKIRKIQLETTHLADDLLAGAWHSAFKGRGMEFEEVRSYVAGDEIRTIDWNVTARMNQPFVKVFREERELTVMLVVDVSASGSFGSTIQLKRDLMAEIGAILAFSAIKNQDKIGLLLFSETVEKYIPPKNGVRHVLRVIRELLAYEPVGIRTDLRPALQHIAGGLSKKTICFLISDFLCPLPKKELSMVAKKHDLIAISIADPIEQEFPPIDFVQLRDLETGELQSTSFPDAQTSKSAEKQAEARSLMQKLGVDSIALKTDEPYLPRLKAFFKGRVRRL